MSISANGAVETTAFPLPNSSYYVWEAAGRSVAVWLNLDVIDRLAADVTSKFTDLTGRGSEVGGLLLGRTANGDTRTFFIDDYELIECDYSDGPLFSLSDATKSRMVEQLHRLKTSSPYSVLGFFRSHTRKNLSLDEPDLALIRDYFAGPATVFLLIKPFAAKPSMAGFFIWEDGEIRAEASYCQFPFKRAELVVRMPEAIVQSDAGTAEAHPAEAAPRLVFPVGDEPPQEPGPVLLKPPVGEDTPRSAAPVARAGRTNADLQRSLDAIIRQITRDPAEKKLFSAGMDLEREQERWSRFALESSIVSRRNENPDPRQESPDPVVKETAACRRLDQAQRPAESRPPELKVQQPENGPAERARQNSGEFAPPAPAAAKGGSVWQRWAWAALFVLFVFGGGYLGARIARSAVNAGEVDNTLDLKLDRDAGALVLHWNRESRVIATAKNASLRIEDSNQSKNFDLSLEQLRFGKIVYFPTGENVNFRLEVMDSGGSRSVSEWVRASGHLVTWLPQNPPTASEKNDSSSRKTTVRPVARRAPAAPEEAAAPAKLIQSIRPEYPEAARAAHLSGIVRVRGVIGRDGRVKMAVAESGPALLREAAVKAVERFLYEPATRNGEPVESPTEVSVNFVWKQ